MVLKWSMLFIRRADLSLNTNKAGRSEKVATSDVEASWSCSATHSPKVVLELNCYLKKRKKVTRNKKKKLAS